MSDVGTRDHWLRLSGYASIAAGALHCVAAGLHAGHLGLARLFLVIALVQMGWGLVAQHVATRWFAIGGAIVHLGATIGWLLSRTTGISFIAGLEGAEAPGPADTTCAALAFIALLAVLASQSPVRGSVHVKTVRYGGIALVVLSMVGVWNVTEHDHTHGNVTLTASELVIDSDGVIISPVTSIATTSSADAVGSASTTASLSGASTSLKPKNSSTSTSTTVAHSHDLTTAQAQALASGWPRAFDPNQPIDFSGIGGVTEVQASRAKALIQNTARDLARYANYDDAIAAGYVSIGDSGFEHVIKWPYLNDGRFLDTSSPESLVYRVHNGTKTLVSAMYIANSGTPVNDATINDYAGGLIQWHVHNNLCWKDVAGIPKVVGVLDPNGNCPAGSTLRAGSSPMVHVWITAHPCGPFAAVEGVAAGISDVPDSQRVDLCNSAH